MRFLPLALLVVGLLNLSSLSAQQSPNLDTQVAVGASWALPGSLFGGPTTDWNSTLEGLGFPAFPASGLIGLQTTYGFQVAGFEARTVIERVASRWFDAPAGSAPRTRFFADSTVVTLGPRWNLGPQWQLSAGLGGGVTRMLLDLYDPTHTTVGEALTEGGQVSLISNSNWTLEGWLGLTYDFVPRQKSFEAGLGARLSATLGRAEWTVAEDRPLGGLDRPWNLAVAPSVWVGFR